MIDAQSSSPVDYVETRMGTLSRMELSNGNTYPAIGEPWGMNYWTPVTNTMGNGWCYQYQADQLKGIKQTHQPSPWMNDYGQFTLMPTTGKVVFKENDRQSWYSHKTEIAKPHYYSVYLADHNVTAEVTASTRAAIFRFTYPSSQKSSLVIDALDKGSHIQIIPEKNRIVGYTERYARGKLKNFRMYFVIQLNKSWEEQKTWRDTALANDLSVTANHAGGVVTFSTIAGEQIEVKVASSFISLEQAIYNLESEVGHLNFNQLLNQTKGKWNQYLGRCEVVKGDDTKKRTFYSCLYRTLLFPNKLYEVNQRGEIIHYSPYDGLVHSGKLYGGTGFWDTFRALYPLLNLLYPEINAEMQEGLANAYLEGGWLPEWSSPGYANIMIGNNSASVVSDAWVKGVRSQPIEVLYEALLKGANNAGPMEAVGRYGAEYYVDLGYVPYDVGINESAARTLEYCYDDFCIYQLGKMLNKPQTEIEVYRSRALNYQKLFNPEIGWMSGKNRDGSFPQEFNPYKWGDAFTEGNALHYSWSVFHDIAGLKELMGGDKAFIRKLDTIFTSPPIFDESYYGGVIHEIREMQIIQMGQYAHGNQPIQHMPYLYNYTSEPWKSQFWVREIMDKLYSATPDGYCGDEDNGQTSAWYVFSALGFYPVCPATQQYVLGSPLFEEVHLHLPEKKLMIIQSSENGVNNRYVNQLLWNKREVKVNFLLHEDLLKGGRLEFRMKPTPNTLKGIRPAAWPYSLSED